MNDSATEFLTVRGLRLHVRRWGRKGLPRLLLLHGFLDASSTFDRFARALSTWFEVIAPDLRGFGLSGWAAQGYWFPDYLADVDALLDHYGGSEASLPLVGHSLGAQIVAAYAGVRPRRVTRLVCLDGPLPYRRDAQAAVHQLRLWLDQQRGGPDDPVDYDSFPAFARRLRKLHPRFDDATALHIAHCWGVENDEGRVRLRADPRHRQVFALSFKAEDYETMWRAVEAPSLFVDGGESTLIQRMGEAARLSQLALFRDHRRVVIPDAGHMLHLDAPDATAQAVLEFLRP